MVDPKEVAIKLLQATALSDEDAFPEVSIPKYTVVDYYRMACHVIFQCQKCGTCCTTGNPIRLRREDAVNLARHLKVPVDKVVRKYTVPDPERKGVLNFKKILPCKFYDPAGSGCKVYLARPWSCRIFPFLGIYGSEDRVKVHESCPGSVEAMNSLMRAMEEARPILAPPGIQEIRMAKEWLRSFLKGI